MRMPSLRLIPHAVACGIFATATVSSGSASPITFAQFVQQNGALQAWEIATSGGSATNISVSTPVFFSFSGVAGLPFAGPESALFSLTASSTQVGNCGVACGPGDSYVQPGYAGTFSFIDTGLAPGANLLSGTFAVTGSPSTTGAQFISSVGGSGAGFVASATPGNLSQLIMTSDYLSLVGQTHQNSSWSLSSLIPSFATGPVSVGVTATAFPANGSFFASGTGTFSSDPGPQLVPEPASMMLLGAGLVGLVATRRRAAASAVTA